MSSKMSDSPVHEKEQVMQPEVGPKAEVSSDDSIPAVPFRLDGGLRAWSTLVGATLVWSVTFGLVNAFGVFQDYYTRRGTAATSSISWIGSIQLFLMFSVGLPSGRLLDLGYFRPLMWGGAIVYIFCLFMLSLADPTKYYQLFLSQGIGMGISAGLIYTPAVSVLSHHFRKFRPVAVGIVHSGGAVGGIYFSIMQNQLLDRIGFAWTIRATGFIVLGCLGVANLLMTADPTVTAPERRRPPLRNILTDTPYLLTVSGAFFVLLGVYYPQFYLQLFAIEHGINKTVSFYMLAVLNATSIIGRTAPNAFVNRFGVLNLIIPATFICGCLVFAFFGATNVGGLMAFSAVYGIFSGAYVSLITHAVASLARDASEVGVRVGVAFFAAGLGALVGNPITGALLGPRPPYHWSKATVFSGTIVVAGATVIGLARQALVRREGRNRV